MNIFTYLRLSALGLCSFLVTPIHAQEEKDYFITVWDFTNDKDNRRRISFDAATIGEVNYSWETLPSGSTGSGKFTANNSLVVIYNLPAKAIIKLKIAPLNFKRFYSPSTRAFLKDVSQWGTVEWSSMQHAFLNCVNLNISAIDLPNLSEVNSMWGMFSNCENLNGPSNINQWDTKGVTNMGNMFLNAVRFNQSLNSWDTRNVSDMNSMFCSATSFNQSLDKWDTKNVKIMSDMFNNASSFNQSIENWNTANVLTMWTMFKAAKTFNKPIGNWNIQKVVNTKGMFSGANSFNQRLDSFKINSEAFLIGMLDQSGIDCRNYSYTLIGWANNPNIPTNKEFGADGLKYSTQAQAARDILTKPVAQGGKGWIITGDALSTEDCGLITANEEGKEQSNLSLYPNPAQDKLFLKNRVAGSSYKIIDGLGKEVNAGIFQNDEISIGTLPAGLYTLLCGTSRFTFVKE